MYMSMSTKILCRKREKKIKDNFINLSQFRRNKVKIVLKVKRGCERHDVQRILFNSPS